MKKYKGITIAVAAVIAISVAPLFAQGFHGRAGHRDGAMFGSAGQHRAHGGDGMFMMFGKLGHLRQALDLSDTQVAQLKAIAKDLRTENQPYREQLRGGMQSVAKTLLANPANLDGAQALIDAQAAAHKAMQTNALTAASKSLSVLTAEQRAKVADFLAKRAARGAQK